MSSKHIEVFGHELVEALKGHEAEYIEARLEASRSSHITYRGKELESIGRTTTVGGNVRALVKGGWGFVSFNNLEALKNSIELAVKQAQLVGNQKSQLAQVEPVVDIVPAEIGKNPVAIPLAEKKQLLDEYNAIIWRTPGIQTSVISYG
ncbi:MAG: TldD/PmbA family protein, partial [Chloroflexi bacterium]